MCMNIYMYRMIFFEPLKSFSQQLHYQARAVNIEVFSGFKREEKTTTYHDTVILVLTAEQLSVPRHPHTNPKVLKLAHQNQYLS